jgi:hypothetical protein
MAFLISNAALSSLPSKIAVFMIDASIVELDMIGPSK